MKLIPNTTLPRHGIYAFFSQINVFYIRQQGTFGWDIFTTYPKIDTRARFKKGMYFELSDEEIIEHVVLETI